MPEFTIYGVTIVLGELSMLKIAVCVIGVAWASAMLALRPSVIED